ncbi:pilus assembly PilX N-terminal domain-containing protein [Candidatus Parcubacteria bacterium]|nr:pilus assembly PilX N-terminal domain-containing protein [Candidatus Parcubacteria bacterium]
MKNQMKNRGFTLFIAVIITAALTLVAMGIISIAVKEAVLTSSGRESQFAFYAADTAMECALYWDVKDSRGTSAFSTTTTEGINCNRDLSKGNGNQGTVGGGSGVSNFPPLSGYITFKPDPYCAKLRVTKNDDNTTLIEAYGYNTCDTANTRRVERAVRATY